MFSHIILGLVAFGGLRVGMQANDAKLVVISFAALMYVISYAKASLENKDVDK